VLDAMNGLVLADDDQVRRLTVDLTPGSNRPPTEIRVATLTSPADP
jgi:Holliday junction resolvase RusA-like endonuclease